MCTYFFTWLTISSQIVFPMDGVQLGLCCLNTVLRAQKPPVFASRAITLKNVAIKGVAALQALVRQNLLDVITMMHWNHEHDIRVFRLSSDLFPHMSNPRLPDVVRDAYNYEFAHDLLSHIGQLAKKYKMRLTMHPGQYNVIGTPNEATFAQTVAELSYHADLLDLMQCDEQSVLVVHGGGLYGNKTATMQRWVTQFSALPAKVKRRLVLENCEKCFSIEDCLLLSEQVNIPVVFDTHHYECYRATHADVPLLEPAAYIPRILETWRQRNIKPKFHISEQAEGGKLGKHSDFIDTIPSYLLEIPAVYKVDIDIMVEAKAKEQAVLQLVNKYKRKHEENVCSAKRIKTE